jgi:hypothetical protein
MGKITWNSKPMHQQQHQQHKHLQGAVDKPNQPKLPAHRRIVFNLSPKFPKAYSHDSPNFTSCPYSIVSPWSSVSSCSSLSPRMSEISGLNSSDSDNSNNSSGSTGGSLDSSSASRCSRSSSKHTKITFFEEENEVNDYHLTLKGELEEARYNPAEASSYLKKRALKEWDLRVKFSKKHFGGRYNHAHMDFMVLLASCLTAHEMSLEMNLMVNKFKWILNL